MTLSTSINTVTYTGDNSTVEFSFPYLFYANGDLTVTVDDVVQSSGITIAGAGDAAGGTVTFDTAPATGADIVIQRIVSYVQNTDFENFDGNPADVTEKQFDLLAMQTQQLDERVDRAILAPIGASLTTNTISGTIDSTARVLSITSSGPSSSTLSDLSSSLDVILSGEASGDFLKYDGANWINRTASEVRTDLGLVIGTNVQAHDDILDDLSGLTQATNKVPYFDSATTASVLDFFDEDDFASDSATALASQQSIKAYTDSKSLNRGTSQATTSGTAIDFTGIDAGADIVILMLDSVSLSGSDSLLIQLGDSGGVETSGYNATSSTTGSSFSRVISSSSGYAVDVQSAANNVSGSIKFTRMENNKWVASGVLERDDTLMINVGGIKSLSGELTTLRLTRTGTDSFDAGSVNIHTIVGV